MILEVGCGVGNFIFPLLQEFDKIFFYACDFSKRAVQFVKVGDLSSNYLTSTIKRKTKNKVENKNKGNGTIYVNFW